MSDKAKNIKKADELDEILGDYKKQKEEREKNFGKIDLEKPEQKPKGKKPVSYTHLDVYKRQAYRLMGTATLAVFERIPQDYIP